MLTDYGNTCDYPKYSYQEGLKQCKVLQEVKEEEEKGEENVLESKNKDEECGTVNKSSR